MDVKSAYQQAKELKRDVYVRLPNEKTEGGGLLKLLVPAYGLTDSGRFWNLTLYEALTMRHGFKQSKIDSLLYLCRGGNDMLLLVVQFDNYI